MAKKIIKTDLEEKIFDDLDRVITGHSNSEHPEELKSSNEKLISCKINSTLYEKIKKYSDENNISIKKIINESLDIYRRLNEIK